MPNGAKQNRRKFEIDPESHGDGNGKKPPKLKIWFWHKSLINAKTVIKPNAASRKIKVGKIR